MPKIQTARLTMWYERYDAPVRKDDAPMILHAGLSMQSVFWPDSLIETLNDEGFDVIVFDNRDIGQTEHLHGVRPPAAPKIVRSEEHTSELQSRGHLVCRLLLEKKK